MQYTVAYVLAAQICGMVNSGLGWTGLGCTGRGGTERAKRGGMGPNGDGQDLTGLGWAGTG
jgi:hypothetical protein